MSKKRASALTIGVLLVILAFHLSVAWQDFGTLSRNGFLYDDSFYALKIAQNIADGKGITFDGLHPTTGFQPLYIFFLVLIFLASGSSLVLPVYMALSLLAVFACLTTYLIYRICRRYVGEAASLIAALIWTFSPVVTKQSANGLETAIAAFMIALSVFYYLDRVRNTGNPPAGRFLILGAFLGLTVLARIDGAFLVLVIFLDYLLLLRKRGTPSKNILRLSLVPLGILLFYGPWFLFNLFETGSPLQDSGTATRFLSLAYASYFGYGADNLARNGPDSTFLLSQATHSIAAMKVIPPVHILFRLIDKAGLALGVNRGFHLAGNIFGFLALFAAGFNIVRWRKDTEKSCRREIDFLLLFSVILVASYSFYIFGTFFFLRYYYPVYLVASVFCAFFLQDLFDWLAARPQPVRRMVIAAGAAYFLLFAIFSYSQAFRSKPIYPFYDIALWVEKNIGEDKTIGVFQAGTIGYLCQHQIINLDGKVNREALVALKTDNLGGYIQEERVDIILDHSKILGIFLGLSSEKMKDCCTEVLDGSMKNSSGWIAIHSSDAFEENPPENRVGLEPSSTIPFFMN